jgi:hypothetical protein
LFELQITTDAVRAIHGHARGMPRAINRLAINALLAAYTTSKTIVDESSARTAIAEETAGSSTPRPRPSSTTPTWTS